MSLAPRVLAELILRIQGIIAPITIKLARGCTVNAKVIIAITALAGLNHLRRWWWLVLLKAHWIDMTQITNATTTSTVATVARSGEVFRPFEMCFL